MTEGWGVAQKQHTCLADSRGLGLVSSTGTCKNN
jgi:hypothetical protein